MDGQMARTYQMVSPFGDAYDHATDIIVNVMLFILIWTKYKDVIPIWCIGLIAMATVLMAMSTGCQQLYCADDTRTEFLGVTAKMCPSRESIVWTRFFGTGTWQWFITWLVIFLHTRASGVTMAAAPLPKEHP